MCLVFVFSEIEKRFYLNSLPVSKIRMQIHLQINEKE